MKYPVVIAPTEPEAWEVCQTIFGSVPSRVRVVAANQERVEQKLMGYHDTCFLILSSRDYSEYFLEEVLPMLELGNRFVWIVGEGPDCD